MTAESIKIIISIMSTLGASGIIMTLLSRWQKRSAKVEDINSLINPLLETIRTLTEKLNESTKVRLENMHTIAELKGIVADLTAKIDRMQKQINHLTKQAGTIKNQ
jgi:chorismate mutase